MKSQMYVIPCRAYFCHLPGPGQVGHSPRETSGSDGTLNWGPMWSGSQSTCHPNASDTSNTSASPLMPLHSLLAPEPYTPWCPIPCWPLDTPDAPHPLLAPEPLHPNASLTSPDAPIPLLVPDTPWCPYTPKPLLAPEPCHPNAPTPPASPWHPLTPADPMPL